MDTLPALLLCSTAVALVHRQICTYVKLYAIYAIWRGQGSGDVMSIALRCLTSVRWPQRIYDGQQANFGTSSCPCCSSPRLQISGPAEAVLLWNRNLSEKPVQSWASSAAAVPAPAATAGSPAATAMRLVRGRHASPAAGASSCATSSPKRDSRAASGPSAAAARMRLCIWTRCMRCG